MWLPSSPHVYTEQGSSPGVTAWGHGKISVPGGVAAALFQAAEVEEAFALVARVSPGQHSAGVWT